MTRKEKAVSLFKEGYNCAQAVVGAFADIIDIDENALTRLSSSFGGGMGRMREVCGAVSGCFMVLGLLIGYDDVTNPALKSEHYAIIQEAARRFKEENGSIVCRELLGLDSNAPTPHIPSPRTEDFYKKRPCSELVGIAAEITESILNEVNGK